MPNPNGLMRNILRDMKVELTDMFDRNFERKGFFAAKWTPRKRDYVGGKKKKGTLLVVTGAMRRSIRSSIQSKSVVFTSAMPYTSLHNDGGKFTQAVRAHTKTKNGKPYPVRAHTRTIDMPKRQFIGNSPEVERAVESIIRTNMTDYFDKLAKEIKQ